MISRDHNLLNALPEQGDVTLEWQPCMGDMPELPWHKVIRIIAIKKKI